MRTRWSNWWKNESGGSHPPLTDRKCFCGHVFCVDAPLLSYLSRQVLLGCQLIKLNYSPVALLLLLLTLKEKKKNHFAQSKRVCIQPPGLPAVPRDRCVSSSVHELTERAPYGSHRGGVVRSPRKLPRSLICQFAAWQIPIDVHSSAMPHRERLLNNQVSSSDVIALRFQPQKRVLGISAVFFHSFSKITAWLHKSIKELRLHFYCKTWDRKVEVCTI